MAYVFNMWNTYVLTKNSWFLSFSRLLRECKSNHEVTQRVSQLTGEWKSQSQKRLRQNFQNFVQGFLVTCFGDLLAGHMSHKKRFFCINRVKSQIVFKKFQFPSHHVHNPFSSPPLPLPKPPFLLTKPPLSSSIFKKMYRFSLIFNLFQVSSLSFLRFGVYVEIWLLNMGFWCFWWVWYMGFVGFHNIMFFFTCLFFIFMHYTMICVVVCILCSW